MQAKHRNSAGIGAALIAIFCLAAQQGEAAGGKALRLFNGKDLTGWRYYLADHNVGMSDVWSVKDGVLICKGKPMGYLYTAKSFKNFRLAVEWRWPPGKKPGNSGILLRVNGQPQPLPRCIECQLQSGRAGDIYGFFGMKIGGPADRLRKISSPQLGGGFLALPRLASTEKPPGQWNRADILVQGGRVVVFINGSKTNEAEGCEEIAGPVALQSEGAEIHFRLVEIAPLP